MKGKLITGLVLALLSFLSAAQELGAPPAIFKPGPEIIAELDEAARNSTSAAGVSVTISPGISVRRRMSGPGRPELMA